MLRSPTQRTVVLTIIAGAALIALVLVLTSVGSATHHRVSILVPEATNVIAGQNVRASGIKVGTIESVEPMSGGRKARIVLRIDDGRAWPVRRQSHLTLRWGGTISFSNRYIDIDLGPTSAEPLPDGATLRSSQLELPVEFDQLTGTFTRKVRGNLRSAFDNAGPSLLAAKSGLARSITAAPPALGAARDVLNQLSADSSALHTMVRSSDQVLAAVHRANPGIGRLLTAGATTLQAFADESDGVKATLAGAPRTLTSARVALRRADRTLGAAADLTDRLSPGISQLRKLTPPATRLLRTIVAVAPDARSTLRTVRRTTPTLNPLLAEVTRLMPTLKKIGDQAPGLLHCIRPYSPEIAGFFTLWADFQNHTDGKDHYARLSPQQLPFTNFTTQTPAEVAGSNPALIYAFPRPPGMAVGQPWLLPECGVGPDALDPSKDPEARNR